jgi:bifunctional DNA-binding transcriptional regulator/antitoxin component of YhaV-PrlF toxin-antitoxin module
MPKSTITSKYQTTIPREVRERLGLGPRDVLQWEVLGTQARVTVADTAFLRRRGTIKTGPGSVVDDIKKARALRGTEVE